MDAQKLLDQIFETSSVQDVEGNSYKLHSHLDQKEGEFLRKIIIENKFEKSIEVGCANGISSLYICSALVNNGQRHHTMLDPVQSTDFKNIGRTNLERAGFDFFDIIEKPSEIALPALLDAGEKYDFGFIDGWHTFDHTLLDFFYLNRMVRVGGIIAIDDVGFPSINKVLRYVLNYPGYELVGIVETQFSRKRRMFDTIARTPFRLISKLLPKDLALGIFSGATVESDKKKGLNSTMIAIRKIAEDERDWNWYKDF